MIKLSEEDLIKLQAVPLVMLKMPCMICMAFPEIEFQVENPLIWRQLPNPVPSNRMCFHIKHQLMCPYCEFGIAPEKEIREMYSMQSSYRDSILKRDDYTCQACGYKQNSKPPSISRRKKNESEAEYLYRRFVSSLSTSDQEKSLAVAHYSKRYQEETYENRHDLENARTLCVDCHNAETAKHQIEAWIKRMVECPWLNKLE